MDKALSKLVDCIRQNNSECTMEIRDVISEVHHQVADGLPDKERLKYLTNVMTRERHRQDAEFQRRFKT